VTVIFCAVVLCVDGVLSCARTPTEHAIDANTADNTLSFIFPPCWSFRPSRLQLLGRLRRRYSPRRIVSRCSWVPGQVSWEDSLRANFAGEMSASITSQQKTWSADL